jgi:D-glycero-alpha-D-manno-heptose-7-phosphate kinase
MARLERIKEQSFEIEQYLLKGDLLAYANSLNHHWLEKRSRSGGMSSKNIDDLYEFALRNGAAGGKIVGAGGGGFLMTYSENPQRLSEAMKKNNIRELKFGFDILGTTEISF